MFKTYTTPPANLLDKIQTQKTTVSNGEDLAKFLTKAGNPCIFKNIEITPNFLTYHFDFVDIWRKKNLKNALSALSCVLHQEVKQQPSQQAHFAITFKRQQKEIVPFSKFLYEQNIHLTSTTFFLGTSNNKNIFINLEKSPQILLAGASGSGKSTALHTIINSLLYVATPLDVKLVLIDPKRVEFNIYKDLPHLLTPVIKDIRQAIQTLQSVNKLMDDRYKEFEEQGIKDISQTKKPHIVVVIDELADLMLKNKTMVENLLARISLLGRAAGIHLILATQRPSVSIVTGAIKANMTTRIALQTASKRDSINILDCGEAYNLIGDGDGLLKIPQKVEAIRFQTAYIKENEIQKIVEYWKSQG